MPQWKLFYLQPKPDQGKRVQWSSRVHHFTAPGREEAEEEARRFLRLGSTTVGEMTYHRKRMSLRGCKQAQSGAA